MGLLQKAVETYDCHLNFVGQYREGHTVLAPVSHIVTRANLEITINCEGNFCAACTVDTDAPKIIIPVTEESAGRTSGVCAHPLCDQLGYLSPIYSQKHQDYLHKLSTWANSPYTHPKLQPILTYIQRGTILQDLTDCNLIKLNEKGAPTDEKLMVCWRVIGLDDDLPNACWADPSLFKAYQQYDEAQHRTETQGLCMISGTFCRIAQQHPKGVIPVNGNAKLISSNDSSGFTYRGRFTTADQAAQIGYEASQKAHNALRWLTTEQGASAIYGGRTFLCWNPQGRKVPICTASFMVPTRYLAKPTEYQQQLSKTLRGYQSELPKQAGVVIAAFDAATSGRLALTYYQELLGSDFLERLYDWDRICCWPNNSFGIQSPSLRQIIDCSMGAQQSEKNNKFTLKTDDKVLRQQMQRLVYCRIDRAPMPSDLVKALLIRASSPLAYDVSIRRKILFVTCAVIRKYRLEKYKEEWNMHLEPDKQDRSYQFGRLLAVLEKAERDTFDSNEDREPNAIRQQSIFCQRPLYAAGNIEKQLEQAYFPRLKPGSRMFYKKLISQIMEQISVFPQDQWNQPLTETYLMGYYLQRSNLYSPKTQEDTEETNHDKL